MLASAISIAAVSALLPAAFASPTLAARACDGGAHVQGKPTSIEGINWPWGGPGEWRVNTALAGSQLYSEFGMRSSAGEWFVEPSTQDPSKYIIRCVKCSISSGCSSPTDVNITPQVDRRQ